MTDRRKTVFVSGCFDLLHSGHVRFLETAAELGDVIVSVGSDSTIVKLKGRMPILPQEERLYLVRSLRSVKEAFVAGGEGILDFARELKQLLPEIFVVNEDGHCEAKANLCSRLGIDYLVLRRKPAPSLAGRTTAELRQQLQLPYRVDLAGGWLDQPFVSSIHPGAVVVASVQADCDFNRRSGMATSTRETAERLWGSRLPLGDPVEIAKLIFACENPPGKEPLAGSQDSLGVALPGISRLEYAGRYWPERIVRLTDDATIAWLERVLWLLPLGPRSPEFDVLKTPIVTRLKTVELARAADACWQAINEQHLKHLGEAVRDSFNAQVAMFPEMTNDRVRGAIIGLPKSVLGYKVTGAGGGGYLLVVAEEPVEDGIPVKLSAAVRKQATLATRSRPAGGRLGG